MNRETRGRHFRVLRLVILSQNSGNLEHIIGFHEIFDVRPFQGDVLKLQDPLLSD